MRCVRASSSFLPLQDHKTQRPLLQHIMAMTTTSGTSAAPAAEAELGGRVLSIQSHVVQGYVGNKSAVFPLQLLGLDVDIINSVQFSNHTGYKVFTGKRLGGDDLHELLDGMETNNLLADAHSHLLTGYIGSVSLLDAIVRVYERLRAAQSHPERLVYVCDPVMGDLGKLYVPLELGACVCRVLFVQV